MKLILTFLLVCFISTKYSVAAVWLNQNEWSSEWEIKYQEWVKANWNKEFFSKKELSEGIPNPYYGFKTDCADVVYSMRVVFAYENKLPFVIRNPHTLKQEYISNDMSRWDKLEEHERFRSFLRYIHDLTSTISLRADTYPVALEKNQVVSGGLIVTSIGSHHSWTIQNIQGIGIPNLVFNSRNAPSNFVFQVRDGWPNFGFVFKGAVNKEGLALKSSKAGIKYWKPKEYLFSDEETIPGYSEQQYVTKVNQLAKLAQTNLADQVETDQQLVARLMSQVCENITKRVRLVQDGVDYFKQNPSCTNYETYDIHSTPNYDRRNFDDLMSLRLAYKEIVENNRKNNLGVEVTKSLDKLFPQILETVSIETANMAESQMNEASICSITYDSNKEIDLAEFKRRLFLGQVSNNPYDSLERRWGEKTEKSTLVKKCKSWDDWHPDLTQE